MAWEASGLRCVMWFWAGRRWPARTNWMYLAFSFVETVACTASWVLRCSQKVFSLWRMADKTELCRQVYRPWWSATGQPLRTWRNVAGLPHMMHAGSTSDTPQRRRFVAVGAVSVVAWRAKRSSASLQLWIRRCHERSWCMCLDQSSHRPCSWRVRRWSSCSATSMSWMYWFTRLRIVRGDGGGRSTDGAAGSKAVVCAEFEMTTVLAICASLAGANFRVHSDCRRAQSSAMSRQRSSEEDSSKLSLMCCCCFQSVIRLRTFRPHWLRPPTKRIEGLAHFGSPTHR